MSQENMDRIAECAGKCHISPVQTETQGHQQVNYFYSIQNRCGTKDALTSADVFVSDKNGEIGVINFRLDIGCTPSPPWSESPLTMISYLRTFTEAEIEDHVGGWAIAEYGDVYVMRADLVGETAPGNQDPSLGGVKFDHGKPNVADMLSGFAHALQAVSRLYDHGGDKYAEGNWAYVEGGVIRYSNAMQRHYLDETIDGDIDKKSGELHATAVAWNALCRLELMLRGEKD